jgi:predicted secreted acid phosphatase
MRARPAGLALAAALALGAATAVASEPAAPASPEAIEAYRSSGEWDADMTAQIEQAKAYLAERTDSRAAIVLDVDDTSLSNYDCLRRASFDRARAGEACVMSADLPAIPQTLELFRFARSHGVEVFFISGRRDRQRAATVTNLRDEGYRGTWRLYLRPDNQPRSRRAGWKARVRRSLVRRGHRIVVNVGDQRSDLTGGSALRTFKLPNPMYVIPVA